mgnify:CR=1 FL=1
MMDPDIHHLLREGTVIPAHPLALTNARKLDERRQRALTRYYLAAGVGGVAVGVHTTQFAIRDPTVALLEPVLQLGIEEIQQANRTVIAIAGICGERSQAIREAELARNLGYHAGLLSLAAMPDASMDELIEHCCAVAEIMPVVGFYLQPAVGGRVLPTAFWSRFAEIENVVAIKIAPFNRYQTLDVIRAVTEAGREDIALYTGNDDNIVMDLLTRFAFRREGKVVERRIVGGLLGHWSVWTERVVAQFRELRDLAASGAAISQETLRLATAVTDANAAFFDAANGFRGCIAGLHEVLRRQRLLEGIWCLDESETLSPGQADEIDRVYRSYPELADDSFIDDQRDDWLR